MRVYVRGVTCVTDVTCNIVHVSRTLCIMGNIGTLINSKLSPDSSCATVQMLGVELTW